MPSLPNSHHVPAALLLAMACFLRRPAGHRSSTSESACRLWSPLLPRWQLAVSCQLQSNLLHSLWRKPTLLRHHPTLACRPGTWQFDPATGTFDRGQMVPLSPLESRRARAVQVAKVSSACCLLLAGLGEWAIE